MTGTNVELPLIVFSIVAAASAIVSTALVRARPSAASPERPVNGRHIRPQFLRNAVSSVTLKETWGGSEFASVPALGASCVFTLMGPPAGSAGVERRYQRNSRR